MQRDVTYLMAGGGRSNSLKGLSQWLAIGLGGALLLALLFASMVNAADEGIALSETQIDAADSDGTVTYTVALTGDPAPTDDVTVAIATDNVDAVAIVTDATTDPITTADTLTLTFTMANYTEAQTVTLDVKDDDLDSEGANISHTSSATDTTADALYHELSMPLRVEINDDDVAGITLSSGTDDDAFDPAMDGLELTEGGAAGTYSVVLDNQPAGDVTVAISSDNDDVTLQGADQDTGVHTLTFAADNWETAQTVTVNVTADATTDDETATLTHDVASADDAKFNALADVTVMVEVTDNDSAGVTIDSTAITAALDEGSSATTYTVVLVNEPTDDVTVTIRSDNGDVRVVGPEYNVGQTRTNVLRFTSENHDTAQTVTIVVGTDSNTEDEKATLTHVVASADSNFTSAAIIAAAGDDAVATAEAALDEGEELSDQAEAKARADAEKTQTEALQVALDINDTTAGVKLSESELSIDETDGTATGEYTAVLRAEPSGDVTVKITISGSEDATLDSADANSDDKVQTLTFTDADWDQTQSVTVNVAADATTDDESAMLTHEISSEDDADYNALGDMTVSVAINDDETPDLTIVTDDLATLVEGGDASSYTVRLAEAPLGDVTVTISSDNADVTVDTDADEDGNQNVLTFNDSDAGTAGSWADEQTVMVSAGMDADNADESAKLSHAVASSADANYSNAAIVEAAGDAGVATAEAALNQGEELSDEAEAKARADAEKAKTDALVVTVNVTDNNIGLRISATEVEIDETDTDADDTYTVQLQVAPTHDVVVAISSDDDSVTVNPASLTFTGGADGNWDTAQTVTLTTAADEDNAHESATITHMVSSNDLRYDGLEADSVAVTVSDDEPRIALSATELEIAEPVEGEDGTVTGGSGSFTVKLDAQPANNEANDPAAMVTVTIESDNADVTVDTDAEMEGDQNVLTFTADDWDMEQTVMVAVAADEDTRDEIAAITLAVTGDNSDLYTADGFSETVTVLISEAPEVVEVEVPGPATTVTETVTVPGPSRTRTVTETVTVEVPAPAESNVVGSTGAATATEVNGQVVITRHDGGASLVVNIGGFIRDESLGQTYQVVRRADGAIVRQWVSPNSPLVYQIPWAVVNSQFSVPVGVIGAIPLDDQSGTPGQLVRRFDGGDDRIFSYDGYGWLATRAGHPDLPSSGSLLVRRDGG